MPIASTDLTWRYSINLGPGNSTPLNNPNLSLGGYASSTPLTGGYGSLWHDITGVDNANKVANYRCIFIYNQNATLTWTNPVVWLMNIPGGAVTYIGVDPFPASPISNAGVQSIQISNEQTQPPGVVFYLPGDAAQGIPIGDLPPYNVKGIWLERVAQATAALNNDSIVIYTMGATL